MDLQASEPVSLCSIAQQTEMEDEKGAEAEGSGSRDGGLIRPFVLLSPL